MATLVVGTFLTLDGVMQGPVGSDEDRSGGFAHGGWSVGYWDEAMGQIITAWTAKADALLLGRTTYEIFAALWPHVPDDDPVGGVLNRVPKYAASTTLKTVEWHDSTLLQGDLPRAVAALKDARSGEIQVHGSCGLLQTLIEHDLVDEYRLWTFPVLLRPWQAALRDRNDSRRSRAHRQHGLIHRRGHHPVPPRRRNQIGRVRCRRARRSRGALDRRRRALTEVVGFVIDPSAARSCWSAARMGSRWPPP